jgi:hypothetical protein
VIEVKFIRRATDHTFPAVSFPDSKLDARGYQSATLNTPLHRAVKGIVPFNSNEAVLKYLTKFILFPPGVNEMENAIVRPDSCLDLLVNSYSLWKALSGLIQLSGLMEFPVLCEAA